MSVLKNRPDTDKTRNLFIRAVTDDKKNPKERHIDFSRIKRLDDIEGKMRLCFNRNAADPHFYYVPGLSYVEALERLKQLPQVALVDLSNSADVASLKTNSAQYAFVRAVRESDNKDRFVAIDQIRRIDEKNGQMVLLYEHSGAEMYDYPVPGISYKKALQALEQVTGRQYVDLRNL